MRKIRAAFVGFGEVNTPPEMIQRKCDEAKALLESLGIELVATPPVTDDPEGNDVARARRDLAGQEFDLVVACVAGWIPSHAVVDTLDPFGHKPVLLWGLSGWREGGRFVTTADQAGTTALRYPLQRMGFRMKYVYTCRGGEPPRDAILSFARAARAAALLRDTRIGMMGFRDMRLYGTLHDGLSLRGRIGPDIECFEMLEVAQIMEGLDEAEVNRRADEAAERWRFVNPPQRKTLLQAVTLGMAVQRKVRERGYRAVSLIDVDGVKKLLNFAPAGAFMLLHEWEDICTVPENDATGAVTQVMLQMLTGEVAPYLEFYEFLPEGMLMGVPDYVPKQVVDGPVTVLPTAFGSFGEGLVSVSKVKTGPATIARLGFDGNDYFLHCAFGDAEAPEAWEEAGWNPPAPQLPSIELNLHSPVDDFAQEVLGQHYMLAYGDHRESLADLCDLLDVEVVW